MIEPPSRDCEVPKAGVESPPAGPVGFFMRRRQQEVLSADSQNSLRILTRLLGGGAMHDDIVWQGTGKDRYEPAGGSRDPANRDVLEIYEFGPFRLEPAERKLLRGSEIVALTPKAFDTLHI